MSKPYIVTATREVVFVERLVIATLAVDRKAALKQAKQAVLDRTLVWDRDAESKEEYWPEFEVHEADDPIPILDEIKPNGC